MQAAVFFMRERHWKAVNYDCTRGERHPRENPWRRSSKHLPGRCSSAFPFSLFSSAHFFLCFFVFFFFFSFFFLFHFHFSRGLLLFHGEIGRCSFIDSLQIHRFVVRLWMDNDSYFSLFLFFFFPSYFQRVGHFYNFLSLSPSNIFVVLATLFLRTFVFISRIQICYSDFIFFLENQRFEFMDLWIFSSI